MNNWCISVLVLLLNCAVSAQAVESTIMLDNGDYRIPAIVNVPDVSAPAAAVLLLHGTASHKNEVGNLYQRLAAVLADVGIGSIRIDFAGTGDSEVDYTQYTLNSAVRDARIALDHIQSLPAIDAARIGVVGFSQGGLIAQLLIAQTPQINSFVAWSSVASDGIGDFAPLFEEHYLTAKEQGFYTQEYSWRAPLNISIEWFEQIKAQQALSDMANFKGALLAIAGSADEVVAPGAAVRLIEASHASPAQAVIIKGASHIFNVLNPAADQDEQLLSLTQRWLVQTL